MIDLRTLHLGPDELLIVAELTISPKATSSDYEVIDQLEQEIRTVLAPKKTYIYLETERQQQEQVKKPIP
ncbi:Cation transporter [Enterococcus sp. HSIEG1]|nr:Cation transporter [Enterococcus sp. HSIEG1]